MRNLPQKIVLALLLAVSAVAQSPHGDSFDYDCELCHEPTSWKIDVKKVKFDHGITKFELAGQHKSADCRSCHTSLEFSKINSDCISCHTDLHQGTVGKDCSKCHTSKTWMVEDINGLHQKGRFPLVGNHLTTDCQSCHTRYIDLYFEPLNTDCYACHSDNYNSTQSPNHVTANFSKQCEDCHNITAASWSTVNIVHDFFPLVGGHAISDCFSCHETGGNFAGLSPECFACHEDDYYNPENDPNHLAANFPTDCKQCHTINGWSPSLFDHGITAFPLTGAHINEQCSSCHSAGFTGTPTDCFACHEDDFNSAQDPNHVQSNFPTTCAVCHSTTAWEPATFDHALTAFPLTGKHITVDCQECHSTGYTGTPTDCFACHQDDFNATLDPNHVLKGYSTNCTECHTTNGWDEILNFNHGITQFPLTGAHISTDCNQCHQQGYTNTPTDCYLCHTEDYNNSTNPNHSGAGFPTTCIDCHSTTAWVPATFDHDNQYFPIYTGEHAGEWALCSDCHEVPNNFAVFTCISCHEHNQIEMDDKHQGVQGYLYESTACLSCHPDGSKGNAFNHSNSIFPLTGAHTTIDCLQCHQSGYSGTPTECLACHQDNYNNAANPSHTALTLPTDCEQCHTTNPDWQPATFPIHNQYFELLGAHTNITNCSDCHNGNFTTTPNTCLGCHQTVYNGTTNPPHQTFNFSQECLECHAMNGWVPANFDHGFYPISGQHNDVSCNECHSQTNYQPQCLSCHQDDFNEEHDPGDPTDCWACHSTFNWDSNFDHSNTNFPLTGAHSAITCQQCHESGYQGTPTECIACHQTNFNNTTNPDHETLMLPTDCSTCHSTNPNWSPAVFPIHNQFFELLGAHANITNCIDCHNGNYTNTPNTCIGCHQDEYNIAPDHVSQGYPTNCEMCHNSVAWNQVTFDHNTTNFPLTGAHISTNCSDCHESGFTGTTTICYDCHTVAYQQSTNPSHTALSLPTDCVQCHTTNPDWQPATFPIHNQFFELLGAHANVSNCADCHNGNYTNTPNTCLGCHQSEFNATTNPPHQLLNFSSDCLQCHNMNGWIPANFNHSFYPISNDHNNVDCNECHSEPNYQPQCLSCHLEDFLDEHEIGDPTNCWDCHTTFDWDTNSPGLKRMNNID